MNRYREAAKKRWQNKDYRRKQVTVQQIVGQTQVTRRRRVVRMLDRMVEAYNLPQDKQALELVRSLLPTKSKGDERQRDKETTD